MVIRKFIGPGYVRFGPITAGPFGIGCLVPTVLILVGLAVLLGVLFV